MYVTKKIVSFFFIMFLLFAISLQSLVAQENAEYGTEPDPYAPTWEQVIHPFTTGFESTFQGNWVRVYNQNTVHCSVSYYQNLIYTRTRTPPHTNDVDWARWRPSIPTTGQYDIYLHIPNYSHVTPVSDLVRYQINHTGGQTTIVVSQNQNKCNWVHLGRYTFNAGTSGHVYMGDYTGDNPTRLLAADAIKFVQVPVVQPTSVPPTSVPPTAVPTTPAPIYVDDGNTGFTSSRGWTTATTNWTRGCSGYAGDGRWTLSRRPGYSNVVDWARWTPAIPQSGTYEVYFHVPGIFNNLNDTRSAKYVITHAGGQTVVTRSQRDNWCRWVSLGQYYFNAGAAGNVYLGDVTGESPQTSVVADGMRWVYRSSTPPNPTPVPTPPPPPPTQSIIQAAKSLTGMPYPRYVNDSRELFCGSHGPWRAKYGVCTDIAIDAYLLGTGGVANNSSCGVGTNAGMRLSTGGMNLELLLYNDHRSNPGRYRWGSARNSNDMKAYFRHKQQYISCSSSDWRVGDIVWFDWGGDGVADHTGIVAQVSNGKPTSIFHSPGCSNCSCRTRTACETSTTYWSTRARYCAGGGRLVNFSTDEVRIDEKSEIINSLRITLVTNNHRDVDIVVYDSSGRKVERIIDYNYIAENNEDFIPYIPYQDYDNTDVQQTITLFHPAEQTYRIELEANATTTYDLTVAYLRDDVAQQTLTSSGLIMPDQHLVSSLVVEPNSSGDKLVMSNLSESSVLDIASEVNITGTIALSLTEVTGINGVTNVQLSMSVLQTQEGLSIPETAFRVSQNNFSVVPGQTKVVNATIHWPGKVGHDYRGYLLVTAQNGLKQRIPITFSPTEVYDVYLPVVTRP